MSFTLHSNIIIQHFLLHCISAALFIATRISFWIMQITFLKNNNDFRFVFSMKQVSTIARPLSTYCLLFQHLVKDILRKTSWITIRWDIAISTLAKLTFASTTEPRPRAAFSSKITAVAPFSTNKKRVPVNNFTACTIGGCHDTEVASSCISIADGRRTISALRLVSTWFEDMRVTYSRSPQVQVSELQHSFSVPRHVALLNKGPQRPSRDLSGSITSRVTVNWQGK